MCDVMLSYSKRNYKVQRNERQSRSERADPSRSEQADHSMSGAIRVDQIRDGEIRLEQTDLRGTIRFEQSRVKKRGEKRGRSDQSENITQREKSRAKREKKNVVRISEGIVRKVLWSRAQQAVQYRMMQSEENIRPEKVDKQQWQSTRKDGR